LNAQKEAGNAGHNGRGAARSRFPDRSSARNGPQDLLAWSKDPLSLVRLTPIAELKWFAFAVHRPNRQYRWQGARHVNAVTSIVTRRGNDEDVAIDTRADSVG
jgi:hypothetical protein